MRTEKAVHQFLTLQDVMVRLKISDSTLRRWIKNGKITACKFEREWRFEESEIKRFIAASRRKQNR